MGLGRLSVALRQAARGMASQYSTGQQLLQGTQVQGTALLVSRGLWTNPAVAPQEPAQHDPLLDNIEPFGLVADEVQIISQRLRQSVLSTVPALRQAAEYFFRPGAEGKRLRPTLAMLMASALAERPPDKHCHEVDLSPPSSYSPDLRRRQQRLAEISETIHVASLLHDDVLDDATTRRGVAALNINVGNKVAILAGDYLLARASVSLAALRNTTAVALMSDVLENLVAGEIMQMTASQDQLLDLDFYLRKTHCKTASLMANSAKSIAVLNGEQPEVQDLAEGYGSHLGLAFQIVDDILDLTASSSILGKPALNDIKSGLATVPVLFAAEEHPELKAMILRKFKGQGDLGHAVELIGRSQGIPRARELALYHSTMAASMIRRLPEAKCDHAELCRLGLIKITQKVLDRRK